MSERIFPRRRISGSLASGAAAGPATDPMLEAVRRLGFIALLFVFVPIVPFWASTFVRQPAATAAPASNFVVYAVGSALSLGMWLATRSERLSPARRLDLGLIYEVLLALVIATGRHATPRTEMPSFGDVSEVGLIVILFAALVPNRPRRVLVTSLAAASMDLLASWLSHGRGHSSARLPLTIALCSSTFVSAGVSVLVSHVVYGLARSVAEARRLGSYLLTEKLGSGGMGEVWRAEHTLLARPAAVKLIRPETMSEDGGVRRFEREAQATATLKSPHTIQVYDFGVNEDGTFYYVMELLDGLDLERCVRTFGPMPAARAVHVLRQVCASLDEAHRRGLVHRDIKPANIYLCRYGLEEDFVKVLDFGLVKRRGEAVAEPALAATQTLGGALVGTPAFMAPEVAIGDHPVDDRTDLYALGCVAYWLLTGQLVFEADNLVKLALEHVRTAPTPPSSRSKEPIPAALDRIVLDCLEKEPDKRPRTAADLERRLAALDLSAEWTRAEATAWWEARAREGAPGSTADPDAATVEAPRTRLDEVRSP